MDRRDFIKTGAIAGSLLPAVGLAHSGNTLPNRVPPHNWGNYDFGPPPTIKNRLNQGPFTTYGGDATANGNYIVMITSPSEIFQSNPGMGLVTYLCDEVGPPKVGESEMYKALEDLVKWPLGDKLYLRVDWRDIQKEKGKLSFPPHWKMAFVLAKKYGKKIAFRVQLMSPVIEAHSVPDFVADKVPFVKLGTTDEIGILGKIHYAPRYDHPAFMSAFKELDDMLADLYDGNELIEYVDTYMYGFWGEGHSWPFSGNPFPDYHTAEQTSIALFEHQAQNWKRTPLATNTQPDFNNVGNSEVLDRTIRSFNWLRTDTIFIEPEQIEALSNRPPWIGATIENGFSNGKPDRLRMIEGQPRTEHIISHILDVAPTYCSLWNWHDLSADNLKRYYDQYPEGLDKLRANIGYKVRPSWIWLGEQDEHPYLILGLVNDGIASVPGALMLSLEDQQGNVLSTGSIDPGYPLPKKVRQAKMNLPKGADWKGLKLSVKIEIKNQQYPVKWSARNINEDGSITLRQNQNA